MLLSRAEIRREKSEKKLKSKYKSHHQYKNWIFDESGKRVGAEFVADIHADLISTTITNKGSSTLYCLSFDLDAHRASTRHIDEEGKIDWESVKAELEEKYGTEMTRYLMNVSRSTGGKGLSLAIAISPLELYSEKTEGAQKLALSVQFKIIMALNEVGAGADFAAVGLKRDFINWRKEENTIFDGEFIMRQVQRDGTPVLSNLITHLNKFKELRYRAKKGSSDYLHADSRVEFKLAALYIDLLNDQLNEHDFGLTMSIAEIVEKYGISRHFAYKWIQGKKLDWLIVTKQDGKYNFKAVLDVDLTVRAKMLVECGGKISEGAIKEPEFVVDGERNEWLTALTLHLKHKGIDEDVTLSVVERAISRNEAKDTSVTFRNAKKIVSNIYKNHPELFGKGVTVENLWVERLLRDVLQNCKKALAVSLFSAVTGEQSQSLKREEKRGVNDFKKGGVGAVPQRDRGGVGENILEFPITPSLFAKGSEAPASKSTEQKDILDRFLTAFDRCLIRASEEEILKALAWVEGILAGVEWDERKQVTDELLSNESVKKYRRVIKYFLALDRSNRDLILAGICG